MLHIAPEKLIHLINNGLLQQTVQASMRARVKQLGLAK